MTQSSLTRVRRRLALLSWQLLLQTKMYSRLSKESSNAKVSSLFLLQPVLAWYSHKLDTHPILTKSISSGIVAGCGDVLGQYIVVAKNDSKDTKEAAWDSLRTGRFIVLGVVLVAPICHVWYGMLMKRVPGHTATAIAKRVALDQAIFAPLFVPLWLFNLWMLEGKSLNNVLENMKTQVPNTVVANWFLWIPAQIVNLGYVTPKYQVLFSNVVAVVWNTYLSYTTHDPECKGVHTTYTPFDP